MGLVEKFRQKHGTTVVMVSHDLNLASKYGDRLLLLKNGKVVKVGAPKTVLDRKLLDESYGCRMQVDERPLGKVARVSPVPDKYLLDN